MDPHHTSSYSYTTGLQSGTGAAAPGSYTTGTTPGLHYSGTYGTTGTTPGLSYSYTQETRLLQDSPLRKSIAAGDIGITTQPASYTSSSYTTPAATAGTGLSGSHHYTTTAPASYTATQYTTAPVVSSTYTTTQESPLKRSYTVTETAAPGGYTAATGETAKRSGTGVHSSGTYGTTGATGTTGTSGTYTSGTYGTYNPTTSYTATSTNPTSYTAPASYTATTQSYSAPGGYTVAPQTDSYHKSTPYLDSLFSGLRQSAVHEVKANIENKHLESTLKNQHPSSSASQTEVLDILKQYGLVSQDRLNDPHKVWQQINPTPEVHSYTSGLYTNLPPSSTQTASYTTPSSYTSTYTAQPTSYTSTNTPASYTSTYTPAASYTSAYTSSYVPTSTVTGTTGIAVTPSTPTKTSGIDVTVKRGGEADKQSRQYQSLPNKSSQVIVPRESLLSPYRHSMYPEFELVEDLPDRSNLIDSINTFLQRSPAKESLLVSPSRVSIKRKSLLSPAEIEFTSLFKEKYEDGSVYEGEGRAGRRHGKGRLTFKDGRTLQGNFRDGRAEGNATVYFRNGKVCYEGGVDDAVYHGQGVLQCETPIPLQGAFDSSNFGNLGNHWTKYEGEFNRGKRHGKGTLYLSNGERFTGEFRDDKVHGQGAFQTRDGRTVQGFWENNVLRR